MMTEQRGGMARHVEALTCVVEDKVVGRSSKRATVRETRDHVGDECPTEVSTQVEACRLKSLRKHTQKPVVNAHGPALNTYYGRSRRVLLE